MSQPSHPPGYQAFDGPSGPPQPGPNPFASQPPTERKPPWRRRLLMLALLVLFVGPCVAVLGPVEIASWRLAAAQEERAAGNKDLAYARLGDALRWSPRQPDLYLQRAVWRLEDGQHEAALAAADQANDLLPEHEQVLEWRAQILQHLDRHAEAIQVWKTLDRLSQTRGTPDRATALNGLAYARAVGKLDLDDAQKKIAAALELEPNNPALLDTRGYLFYLQGKHAQALGDMDAAVKGFEGVRAVRRPPEVVDTSRLNTLEQGQAVVRYHRALVLRALGREKDAQADLDRARQLIGREPDEKLF